MAILKCAVLAVMLSVVSMEHMSMLIWLWLYRSYCIGTDLTMAYICIRLYDLSMYACIFIDCKGHLIKYSTSK